MVRNFSEEEVERAAATLVAWCDDREPGVLADLVSALARARVPGRARSLTALVRHPDGEVRLVVAQALAELEDVSRETIAALVALSRDSVEEVRSWATFALAGERLGDADGVHDALVARLDDDSEAVRVEAVRGLALRGDVRAVDAAFELAPQWSRDPMFRDAVARIVPR